MTQITEKEKVYLAKEDIKIAEDIRQEILEFAHDEIRDLIKVEKVIVTKDFQSHVELREHLAYLEDKADRKADEKAFLIALKFFMIHDIRLKGGHTLSFISTLLGITRERIRQIEDKAMKQLKNPKFGRSFFNYVTTGNSAFTSDF